MKTLEFGVSGLRFHRPLPPAGLVRVIRGQAMSPATAGILLAFITASISGLAIFVNSYAVREFDSPTVFTTLKNALVGLALLAMLARPTAVADVRTLPPARRMGLLALAVIGGSVPFVLFFEGLARVESGNAAFLHKTLFVWVAVLAVVFLRERLGRAQLGALAALVLAQWLLGGPGDLRLDRGTAMVFAAALLWSVEVIVAKRVLASAGTGVAATSRMALGGVLLLAYLGLRGGLGELAGLSAAQWGWALATAVILFGYVTTWYGALKRAPATAVTCVLAMGAPITAALDAVAGRGLPEGETWIGYAVLVAAAVVFAALAAQGERRPVLVPADAA